MDRMKRYDIILIAILAFLTAVSIAEYSIIQADHRIIKQCVLDRPTGSLFEPPMIFPHL